MKFFKDGILVWAFLQKCVLNFTCYLVFIKFKKKIKTLFLNNVKTQVEIIFFKNKKILILATINRKYKNTSMEML